MTRFVLLFFLFICLSSNLSAQDNYEIQVYGSETVAPGATMFELHSNYTIDGSQESTDGVMPTEHAFHETLEITHGITSWSEVGFYFFTSARDGNGWQWVGDHIRPRVRVPEEWHWPVGVSLSTEFGYQQRTFSTDTWTGEFRPISDWQSNGIYVSLNPTFDVAFHGEDAGSGLDFSPNIKISYDITSVVTAGVEYYGSVGPATGWLPANQQEQQIFPSLDLNVAPEWELNCGLGFGLTPATDHLIFKTIVGRRIGL